MARHLFLSVRGDLLPRWREAFPEARASRGHGAPGGPAPDLVWIRLPAAVDPAQVLGRARAALGGCPLIALSDRPDDGEALACLAAGARGYCNSHAQPELLRQVAAAVGAGGLWIGETLMSRLLQGVVRLGAPAAGEEWGAALTERERQVARAVAAGASNKEIARQLGITERTVKAHTGAIFEKLGVRDRLQLSLRVLGRPG